MAPVIKIGDSLPSDVVLFENTPDEKVNLAQICSKGTYIIFGVPGAFTPGCSKIHLPGFIKMADNFKNGGVQDILCISVNDPYVMAAWGKKMGATGKVRLLADTQARFTKAIGLDLDACAQLGSIRCRRFSMVVADGVVIDVNIEPGDGLGTTCSIATLINIKKLFREARQNC